jgi:hypothetical protein
MMMMMSLQFATFIPNLPSAYAELIQDSQQFLFHMHAHTHTTASKFWFSIWQPINFSGNFLASSRAISDISVAGRLSNSLPEWEGRAQSWYFYHKRGARWPGHAAHFLFKFSCRYEFNFSARREDVLKWKLLKVVYPYIDDYGLRPLHFTMIKISLLCCIECYRHYTHSMGSNGKVKLSP